MLIRRTILAFSALALTAGIYAETPPSDPDFLILIKKGKKKDDPDPVRHKMPGMDRYLSAEIANGVLTLEFPADAETGVVTIGTGDFTVFSAAIDRAYPSVELPPLSGDFLLTVTFDNDDTYEGEISF